MDLPRDNFLPRAALAGDQDLGVRRGDIFDLGSKFSDTATDANERCAFTMTLLHKTFPRNIAGYPTIHLNSAPQVSSRDDNVQRRRNVTRAI
jgi:hypothetical protein